MSQENVEIVRQGYEHYNRTGEPDFGAFDPEVQWISDPRTGQDQIRGRDKLIEFFADRASMFSEMRIEVERTWDWDDQVLAFVRVAGSGSASGAGFEIRIAHLWTLLDGKLIRCQGFGNRDEALEAAGLRE
jgi:ketosteroid isomerase-like protein